MAGVIHEAARLVVAEERAEEFEQAIGKARSVICQAPGFVSIEVWRGIEHPRIWTLLVKWRSVEDHVDGFRKSPLYEQWSALVRPLLAEPPQVEHHQPRMNPFRG